MQPRKRARVLKVFAVLMVGAVTASFRASSADDRQRETASLARDILNRRCFSCHGANGVARKNVFVLDRERLVATQVVVPGDRASLLLRLIESGAMPEGGPPLSDQEKSVLREWVIAGAPHWDSTASPERAFIDEREIVTLIEQDLLNQPQRSRQFLRYFSLAHLYNAGVPELELGNED